MDQNEILAALFDITRSNAPLVDFTGSPHDPGYELHGTDFGFQRRALAALASAGLATEEVWAGKTFYRLNVEARAALAVP